MAIPAFEIAFAACTIMQVSDAPAKQYCREIVIPLRAEATLPYHCMFAGQAEIANWARSHPNWIRRPGYQCRRAGQVANI